MKTRLNDLGLPIGDTVEDWQPCARPPHTTLPGRYCDLVPLSLDHATELHAANCDDEEDRIWVYLAYGPFETEAEYRQWMTEVCFGDDPLFYAVVDIETRKPGGVASFLRIDPAMGVIEVGHINYAPVLQRSCAATEAMYLMMKHVFDDLGYRRYEWKCDALNARSRRAAERLGFTFEGVFRQAMVYNGRNRDSAWYSVLDSEWPAVKSEFERWLSPDNFKDDRTQRSALCMVKRG